MICYECSFEEKTREAVALCHNCGAGLCKDHIEVVPKAITTTVALGREVELPIKARQMLCQTCKAALQQPRHKPFGK